MNIDNNISRKSFISQISSSAAGAILAPRLLSALEEFSATEMKETIKNMNPIIPFKFYPDSQKEMYSALIQLRKQYGFRRFLFIGPSKEFRSKGFPSKHVFVNIGEQISKAQEKLSEYDIKIGWWCTTTINSGNGPFQNIVKDNDGSIVTDASCPLDTDFKNTLSDYVATVVKIANPFMVNFEDDYYLQGGCSCPLHLKEFNNRQNRSFTRKEIQTILEREGPLSEKNREIIKAWYKLKRDSLSQLAASIREAVDDIDPQTRLCLCQSGRSEKDGNFTESVTKAFAGDTKPIVRVYGTSYNTTKVIDLPSTVFNPLYQSQHLPDNFELIHESDTFPHIRFFMSASEFKSMLTAVYAYGLDDSLLYITQYLPNPLEEKGYRNIYKKEYRRLAVLKEAVRNCNVEGCEIYRRPRTSYNWVQLIGRLGIPYTTIDSNVKLVSGNIINQMSEREISDLLEQNILLDGRAAYLLSQRGYSTEIGAKVDRGEGLLGIFEGVTNHSNDGDLGNRLMWEYAWNWGGKDAVFRIRQSPKANIVTRFYDSDQKAKSPALIQFANNRGGRIGIMAYNLFDNYVNSHAGNIFNYTKKIVLSEVIEWLGEEYLPVYINNIPNAFCIFNRSQSNDHAVVVIISMSPDTFDSFSLKVAPEWMKTRIDILNIKAQWESADIQKKDRTLYFNKKLSYLSPIIVRFAK